MDTLTKRLAGPSTGKAGMDSVDQSKVNDIIYKASEVYPIASTTNPCKGSKYFENERKKDIELTNKINDMLKRLKAIEGMDLSYEQRKADEKVISI
jgi:DNA polymerase kappa